MEGHRSHSLMAIYKQDDGEDEHQHDPRVSSVGMTVEGELDEVRRLTSNIQVDWHAFDYDLPFIVGC